MAVMYKLRQEKNPKSKFKGQWYARAIAIDTVDTATIANIMQQNCTLKKADILAVIAELIDVMKEQLQNSKVVRLDGLAHSASASRPNPLSKPKTSTPLRMLWARMCSSVRRLR